jgi:hypothetical protein
MGKIIEIEQDKKSVTWRMDLPDDVAAMLEWCWSWLPEDQRTAFLKKHASEYKGIFWHNGKKFGPP